MWTCALVAFFGSFRLGELLCKHPNHFDATSSLLGKHLTYCKKTNTWEIWLQSPKSNAAQGEKMVLFPLPNPKLCPVVFLTRFQKQKNKYGLAGDSLPFFRFRSGRNVTVTKMNIFLHRVFPPTDGNRITGHSFRSGLISSAANYPDLVQDTHLKGWGRWNSKAYLRYEHYDFAQKQYIFHKLVQNFFPSLH